MEYNLFPPDKLMSMMVDVMVDKQQAICVQHGVVVKVLWDTLSIDRQKVRHPTHGI